MTKIVKNKSIGTEAKPPADSIMEFKFQSQTLTRMSITRNVQSLYDRDLRSWSVLLRNEFSELARDCFLQDVSDNFVGADEITGQRASHSRYLERLDQSFVSTVLDITTNVHVLGFPSGNHYRPNANIDALNPQNGRLNSTVDVVLLGHHFWAIQHRNHRNLHSLILRREDIDLIRNLNVITFLRFWSGYIARFEVPENERIVFDGLHSFLESFPRED